VSINPETGVVETLAEGLTIGLPGPGGVPESYTPTGVAVSPAGTVYFSSDIEDALYKLTRN
jgi:DNA-binding beta-propeller fold protein YncE